MKTKAAILVEQLKPLVVDEVDIPKPLKGQVLVQIRFSSICGQQLDEIAGRKGPDKWLPHLLGHEGSGVVEAVGEGVTQVQKGDHVVLHWRKGPGLEGATPTYSWNGQNVNAGWITTFQQKTIVSENRLTRIPKTFSMDLASLFGCCVTTAFGVIHNDAKLKKGESMAVLGAGGMGLAEILAAKMVEARLIIAVDRYDQKLKIAKELGATHLINSTRDDVRKEITKIAGTSGLDVVIENTGLGKIIELSYELAGPQGRTILVGVPRVTDKASIDTLPLHFGKILTGSHGGDTQPHVDIPKYMKMHENGLYDISKLITHRFSLNDINTALQHMRDGKAVRCLIEM